jgi:hypothetical protein
MAPDRAAEPIESLAVVMFSYNYRRFMAEAVQGVLAQRRRPDRVMVNDDCSPEDSEADLRATLAPFPDVELRRHAQNIGVVANYRQGIATVDEDAYMLHSCDDVLVDKDFLSDAVAILDAHPNVVVVFGTIARVDLQGRQLAPDPPRAPHPYTLLDGAELRVRLAYDNPIPAPCTVVRTSVHAHVPPFPLDSVYRHDWQQWYLLSYYGDFAHIERPVMRSRVHGSNLSVGAAASRRMHAAVTRDYEDLIARPEVTPADEAHLRAGLARKRMLGATLAELPAELLRQRGHRAAFSALAEGLSARVARSATALAERVQTRGLVASVGGPVGLDAIAKAPSGGEAGDQDIDER